MQASRNRIGALAIAFRNAALNSLPLGNSASGAWVFQQPQPALGQAQSQQSHWGVGLLFGDEGARAGRWLPAHGFAAAERPFSPRGAIIGNRMPALPCGALETQSRLW